MPLFYLLLFFVLVNSADAVSVMKYGAKGDGVTDDTMAIQAALNSSKGPVSLPDGRYLLSKSLQVPSGSGIKGDGTLYQTADVTTIINATGEEKPQHILIEGIKIEKKFVDNSVQDGIRFEETSDIRIKGVEVTGISAVVGIYLNECTNFSIADCYIHDFSLSATERPLPGGRGPDGLGISTRRSSFGQISGNRIENLLVTDESANALAWQTDGINPVWSKYLTITGNTVRNAGEGIDLVACESCTVTGNTFEDCWHFGVKVIHGSRYCTIGNNTIRNAALAGMSLYFGNPENGTTYGNVVTGNTIVNTGGLKRSDDQTTKGIWRGWPYAGIEIVNDNREGNSVYDFVIANNVIYDDQKEHTCKYGIIERYIRFEAEDKVSFTEDPVDDGGLFTNLITGNLIRGMAVKDYACGSMVRP
jgi:parallel beta-helix repeat protein